MPRDFRCSPYRKLRRRSRPLVIPSCGGADGLSLQLVILSFQFDIKILRAIREGILGCLGWRQLYRQ